jgi:hypothetical protein
MVAWSVSRSATIAALSALWGLLASLTTPRTAIAAAGVLILAPRSCSPGTTAATSPNRSWPLAGPAPGRHHVAADMAAGLTILFSNVFVTNVFVILGQSRRSRPGRARVRHAACARIREDVLTSSPA